jgi:predicted transcriptional regulator
MPSLNIRASFPEVSSVIPMEKLQVRVDTLLKTPDLTIGQMDDKKVEKRDKLDLLLELLEATSEPIKKTHLIYKLRINYYQLSRYLDLLLRLEMVREVSVPFEGYVIAEKGRLMQKLFSNVRQNL